MNVRKVAVGSVLAAGLGVAGLFGAGAASADPGTNGTTNDAHGYGVANYNNLAHNVDDSLGSVGSIRSTQTGAEIAAQSGTNRVADLNGVRSTQGDLPPISNKDGNKFVPAKH
jgi:hypothetical protein